MDEEIKAVENMVRLASQGKEPALVSEMVAFIQARLIAFKCLQAAVKNHENQFEIFKSQQDLLDTEMKKIAGGK